MVGTIAIAMVPTIWNPTIWNLTIRKPTSKMSGFWMIPVFEWSVFRSPLYCFNRNSPFKAMMTHLFNIEQKCKCWAQTAMLKFNIACLLIICQLTHLKSSSAFTLMASIWSARSFLSRSSASLAADNSFVRCRICWSVLKFFTSSLSSWTRFSLVRVECPRQFFWIVVAAWDVWGPLLFTTLLFKFPAKLGLIFMKGHSKMTLCKFGHAKACSRSLFH